MVTPVRAESRQAVAALARTQAGVLSAQQAMHAGMSRDAIRHAVESGRWRRIHLGVMAIHAGKLDRDGERWAALLAAGPDAVLSHRTAGELHGLVDPVLGAIVDVAIPHDRRVRAQPGIRVHRLRGLSDARHPVGQPPRLRVEDTVLLLANDARTADAAMGVVFTACQKGRTTPSRLRAAMTKYGRLRWREMLCGALDDASTGTQSLLEQMHLRRVVRAHGLPEGRWQVTELTSAGVVRRDQLIAAFQTIVELDGRLGHEDAGRFRDMERDNGAALNGRTTLRFGWADTCHAACRAAALLAVVLIRNGWRGRPRRCSRSCTTPDLVASMISGEALRCSNTAGLPH